VNGYIWTACNTALQHCTARPDCNTALQHWETDSSCIRGGGKSRKTRRTDTFQHLSVYWPKGKRRTVALGGDSRGFAGLSRAASVRAPLVVLVEAQGRGVGARPHGSQRGLKVRTAHALRLQALLERCQRGLAADGLEGKGRRNRWLGGAPAEAPALQCGAPSGRSSGAQGPAVRRCRGAQVRGRPEPRELRRISVAARTPRVMPC